MKQNVEVVSQAKKEDKKHFKKFLLIMLCSLLGGGVLGFVMGLTESLFAGYETMDSYAWMRQLQMQMGPVFRILMFVVAGCYVVALMFCHKAAKKKMTECDIEDEEQCKAVEKRIEIGLAVSGVGYLLLFLCFGMGAGAGSDIERKGEMPLVLVTVVVFLISMAVLCFFQNRFVRMTKELYPEKRGSIYDTKFQKTWIQSCDEAERMMIYQVCHKVFLVMNHVYSVAAVVFFMLSMMFGISSLIFMTIMVLWMISQGVYFYASAKIEKNFVQ